MDRVSSVSSEGESFQVTASEDIEDIDSVTRVGAHNMTANSSVSHVSVTGITGGNAETVTAVGILHGNIMISRDHRMKSLKDKTIRDIQDWTRDMLLTSSVDLVMQRVRGNQRWITITGNPGEGKTTTGYLVLKKLMEVNHLVFKVDTPEDYFTITRKTPNCVILMNDVLGAFDFDPSALSRWETVFHHFLDRSAKQRERDEPEIGYIIFVSRRNVVEGARKRLGKYEKDMFRQDNVVDLSSNTLVENSMAERLKLLDFYLQKAGIEEVGKDLKDRIVSGLCPHGFPHCCKMYSELSKTCNKQPDIETFFSNPLPFLAQTTKVLIEKPQVQFLFKEMLKQSGKYALNCIEDDTKRDAVTRAAEELHGSYLKQNEETLVFAHPSIHESVALCIGQSDPMFAVQHFDVAFILQKVKFIEGKDTPSEDDLYVEPTGRVIQHLCKRFVPDILTKDFSILQHDVCRREDVCTQLITNCVGKKNVKKQLKDLLKQKKTKTIDVNCKDRNGNTMLHVAHRSNNETAVETLLRFGADVNIRDQQYHNRGNSFFHLSCMNNPVNPDLLKELINCGASVNSPFDDGNIAMHSMYHRKEKEVFEMLLENGSDVNFTDARGKTVLHHMCKDGASKDDILLLVNSGANVNTPRSSSRRIGENDDETDSESEGEPGKSERTLGKLYGRKGKTPLHYLCLSRGDVKIIEALIQHGASVNKADNRGRTALHHACEYTHLEVVKCLLEHGAHVDMADSKGNKAIHYLYDCDNKKGIDILLEHGADVNSVSMDGKNLLHYHCDSGQLDLEFLQLLLTHGSDVNKRRKHRCTLTQRLDSTLRVKGQHTPKSTLRMGKTALHYVSRRDCMVDKCSALKLLLENGGNVNITDNRGKTPIHYAWEKGDDETFSMLLAYGSDVNIADQDKNTVLHSTYHEGQTDRLMMILKHGTDVNKEDRKGKTFVHYVCASDATDESLLELLIKNGADVNKRRRYRSHPEGDNTASRANDFVRFLKGGGKTPLHYACDKVKINMAIIEQLLMHGSSVNADDKHGMTPLHYLLINEEPDANDLQLFISFGADVCKVNNIGQTALHLACSRRNVDSGILNLLLQNGVDIRRADKEGKIALDYLGLSVSDRCAREILEKYELEYYQPR